MYRSIFYYFGFIALLACGNTSPKESVSCDYKDGRHEATVEYSNAATGHRSTYTLDVEVEDCYVTVIYWPSGGWSDSDHIRPGEINNGSATVVGEEGKVYLVKL